MARRGGEDGCYGGDGWARERGLRGLLYELARGVGRGGKEVREGEGAR
jgi:hypothetical protein